MKVQIKMQENEPVVYENVVSVECLEELIIIHGYYADKPLDSLERFYEFDALKSKVDSIEILEI